MQRALARAGLGVAALPIWCGDPDPVLDAGATGGTRRS